MGKELIGAARGNRFGHFEDVDFVTFHSDLLSCRGCHMFSPAQNLEFTDNEIRRAKSLVYFRQREYVNWGWKDPRTTLFLSSWYKIIPDARFILLYRHPRFVIDSLLRRATDRRLKFAPWIAASAWIRYNEIIVSFCKDHRAQTILININGFNQDPTSSVRLLEDWLDLELPFPYSEIFHPSELKVSLDRNIRYSIRIIDMVYGKQMNELYQSLESLAAIRER